MASGLGPICGGEKRRKSPHLLQQGRVPQVGSRLVGSRCVGRWGGVDVESGGLGVAHLIVIGETGGSMRSGVRGGLIRNDGREGKEGGGAWRRLTCWLEKKVD